MRRERYGVMLANPFNLNVLSSWDSVIVQPKIDGIRCRYNPATNTLYTAYGRAIRVLRCITSVCQNMAEHHSNLSLAFDGEISSEYLDFDTLSGIIRRQKYSTEVEDAEDDITFQVFDLITREPQHERINLLNSLRFEFSSVRRVPSMFLPTSVITDAEEDAKILALFEVPDLNPPVGEMEGLIFRNPCAMYQERKTNDLMKLKYWRETCGRIKGMVEEVSKDGMPKGTLGALVVTLSSGVEVRVGGGSFLTKAKRVELWNDQTNVIGKFAIIKYQRRTTRGSLRHPQLIAITNKRRPY